MLDRGSFGISILPPVRTVLFMVLFCVTASSFNSGSYANTLTQAERFNFLDSLWPLSVPRRSSRSLR